MVTRARRLSFVLSSAALVIAAGGVGLWVAHRDAVPTARAQQVARATELRSVPPRTMVTEPPPGAPVATDSNPAPSSPAPDAAASLVVTYSGWDAQEGGLEVDGFVSNLVNSTGTCTLRASKGAQTVSVNSTAEADATTMQCGALVIPAAQVGPGTWRAVLSYRSSTAAGQASAVTIDVPAR